MRSVPGEQLHTEAVRYLAATQIKHDTCVAQCLNLFETKEKHRASEIKKAVQAMAKVILDVTNQSKGLTLNIVQSTNTLDVDADLRDFIFSTYGTSTPMHIRLQPKEIPEFSKHLGFAAYENSVSFMTKAMTSLDTMSKFLEDQMMANDVEVKAMRKFSWVNASAATLGASTLTTALDEFRKLMEGYCTVEDRTIAHIRNDVIGPLQKLKTTYKSRLTMADTEFQTATRQVEAAQTTLDAARQKQIRAQDNFQAAQVEVARAEKGEDSKGGFMSLFQKSLETRKQELADARANADKSVEETKKAEEALIKAEQFKSTEQDRILAMFRETEEKRFAECTVTTTNLTNAYRAYNNDLSTHVARFAAAAAAVDPISDGQAFITALNHQLATYLTPPVLPPPPACVIEEHDRSLLRVVEEQLEEQARKAATAAQEAAVSSALSLFGVPPTATSEVKRGGGRASLFVAPPPPPSVPPPSRPKAASAPPVPAIAVAADGSVTVTTVPPPTTEISVEVMSDDEFLHVPMRKPSVRPMFDVITEEDADAGGSAKPPMIPEESVLTPSLPRTHSRAKSKSGNQPPMPSGVPPPPQMPAPPPPPVPSTPPPVPPVPPVNPVVPTSSALPVEIATATSDSIASVPSSSDGSAAAAAVSVEPAETSGMVSSQSLSSSVVPQIECAPSEPSTVFPPAAPELDITIVATATTNTTAAFEPLHAVPVEVSVAALAESTSHVDPMPTPAPVPEPELASVGGSTPADTSDFAPQEFEFAPQDGQDDYYEELGEEWSYQDLQGDIQGPFSKDQMCQWWADGFFTPELRVRCDPNAPFVSMLTLFAEGNSAFLDEIPPM